jgi:hypothetical protein
MTKSRFIDKIVESLGVLITFQVPASRMRMRICPKNMRKGDFERALREKFKIDVRKQLRLSLL